MHSVILQRLGGFLRNFGIDVRYPHETFRNVSYDGKPVIFWDGAGAPHHPDFDLVSSGGSLPHGYRKVGMIRNTRIDGDLQRADAEIDDKDLDSEIAANPGNFTVSTGFWGTIANGIMKHVNETNHVLLFRRNGSSGGPPNDAAAAVCNTKTIIIEQNQLDDGIKLRKIDKMNGNVPIGNTPPIEDPEDTSGTGQVESAESRMDRIESQQTQLAGMMENLQAAMAKLVQALGSAESSASPVPPAAAAGGGAPAAVANTPDIERLKEENEKLRASNEDYAWRELAKKLPANMRNDVSRASYKQNPTAFLMNVVNTYADQKIAAANPGTSVGVTGAIGNTPTKITTYMTPKFQEIVQRTEAEIAQNQTSRGQPIGNTAGSGYPAEGTRIGPHQWQLPYGFTLDTTQIDKQLALERLSDREAGEY